MATDQNYDALLIVGFGGPEGPDDILPFLDNVLRGKPVPEERKLEVAEHYRHFGGVSPYNEQIRALMEALRIELKAHGLSLPVYWGNRNWHPMLEDALRTMRDDGCRRALAFFVSAYSCYSGCRQYRENIQAARAAIGEGAPEVDKIRMCFNHPGFIEAIADRVRDAIRTLDPARQPGARLVFTAHSLPLSMADPSDYVLQLKETCGLTAAALGLETWDLVYQSRSGAPHQPWLEPDICDHLESLADQGVTEVVLSPVGFLSDHVEVLYDLDTEAAETCAARGLTLARAQTVGTHPRFVRMIRELVEERVRGAERLSLGGLGPWHDRCPENCCPSGAVRRPTSGSPACRPGGA